MPKMTYAVLVTALCASSAHAADKEINRPKVYSDIVACRALADTAARLQCFDAAAKAFEDAAENRQIVMLDQGEVRKTKRSLFGFSLPKIPFFGESDEEQDEEFKQVEGELAGVQAMGGGRYQFTVKDAGTWQTTEASWLILKNGLKFKIKRGAVGSYMLVINNSGIRVKRVN
jgi:hypothetical protein